MMILSQLHTRLLFKHATMTLMLIEYMERYRVGFGWTGSTLALNLNVSLLSIRSTMTPSQLHTRLLFKYNANDIRPALRWCWLNIWICIVLALDEQLVSWCWCTFEFECIITCCTINHGTNAIAHSPAIQLQWQWHTALRLYWCWLNIWICIILALDEQAVR